MSCLRSSASPSPSSRTGPNSSRWSRARRPKRSRSVNGGRAFEVLTREAEMLLDLSEIVIRQGMRVGHDVDQPSVEDPDLVFSEPLQGRLTFVNSGDLLSING